MSTPTRESSRTSAVLVVDRIACAGHGICANLLPEQVTLDEWGYPIIEGSAVDPKLGAAAVRLCPAAALRLQRR